MTTALIAPVVEKDNADNRDVHWCCVAQIEAPLIGLCGELPVIQRRKPGARVNCRGCLDAIADHLIDCPLCRPCAGRYR